jgi:hypothetical protein
VGDDLDRQGDGEVGDQLDLARSDPTVDQPLDDGDDRIAAAAIDFGVKYGATVRGGGSAPAGPS